jgi:branched-chain amino acid transport system permease protein
VTRPATRTLGGFALFTVGVVIIALLPQLVSAPKLPNLVLVGVYFIAMIGLNILTGYSGQISLGHGAFMGIGGYTTAILVTKDVMSDVWTIPIAGLVAGIVGFLFGFPALRLTGVYLALATFGLAVAFISLAQSSRFEGWTGGGGGLQLALPKTPYYLTWGIACGLFVFAWLLLRGRLGRRFRAVRDAPLAAVSSGVNLPIAKTLAFGVSAFYAGVAGALLAILVGFINYLSFPVTLSITLLVGAALGGFGSLAGVIFGALFVVYAPLYAADISKEAPALMYGLILLAVLFLVPGGAAQVLKSLLPLLKRAFVPLYSRLRVATPTRRGT